MKKILLDTNAYIELLKGADEMLALISRCEVLYMSMFVLGELYYGFKKGSQETRNANQLEAFLQKPSVRIAIPTTDTPKIFGSIKKTLSDIGRPVPVNDVWIAAQTIETGAWLVTLDRHFDSIPGLLCRRPGQPNS